MKKMNTKDNAGRMSTNYPLLDSYLTLTRPLHAYRSIVYFFAVFAMLFLGGWNTQAWAWRGARVYVKSQPEIGGLVDVSTGSADGYSTSEKAEKSESGLRDTYFTFYLYQKANDGYAFKGWSTDRNSTSGFTDTNVSVKASGASVSYNEYTYYAIFSPISYKIVFNGNGNTSGSMSKLSMVYGTAKSLTNNAFQKQYTITYNADGGSCATASSTVTYTFSGWEDRNSIVFNGTTYAYTTFDAPYYANTYEDLKNAFGYNKYSLIQHYVNNGKGERRSCKGTTPGLYPNKASVNNLTTTAGATVTLYAHWDCANPSVTLPSATKAGYVLEGWYDGSTKVGEAGGSYTPTGNVTLKANWTNKFEPVMEGANTSMMVGSEQTNAFTFEHVSGQRAHITVKSIDAINNGDGKVIEYDATNNKIIAHNAGVAEIYFTQTETSTIKSGTSATYTYTVYKYNSEFAKADDLDVKVDADVKSKYTLTYTKPNNAYLGEETIAAGTPVSGTASNFYYTLTQTVTSSNTVGSPDATVAIIYNAGNKTATGKNAGTGTIHLRQPETYKYKAASADIKVTVTKNDPVFTWKNGPYYHNSSVSNVFTSTNKDLAYTIGASTNPNVAYESGNTLYILTKAGTAKFTVSQPENYKWNNKSVTYNVTPENPYNHVTLTYTQAMYNDGSITVRKEGSTEWTDSRLRLGGSSTSITDAPAYNWDDKYVDIAFKGIPEKVTFEIATNSGAATGEYWYVKESSDGKNWSGEKWSSEHEGESYASFSVPLSQTARYIRLCYSGNFAGYFRNITIHELKKFTPNPSSLDFGTHPINETCASQNFTFNYANVGHNVTLATNDSHFTVTPTKITNIGGEKVGSTTVTVSYSTTEAHKSSGAHVTITDELGNSATVNLSGETKRLDPTITWSPDDATFNVDEELTALNKNELEVTLSVAAADAAYVHCEGNTATMIGAKTGTVEVTAHVTGNSIYNDKDFTKEISITNLTKQYITWEQDFSRLKTTDGTRSIVLNATASSSLPVTYELVGDKTGLSLTQSGNTWTLTYSATECKNTTIVAKQGGDETYASAPAVSKTLKVVDPTKVCDTNETLVNSTVTLKETSTTYNIDIPSTMTIQVSRTKTSWAIYLAGFKVELYSGRNGTGTKLHEYSYGAGDIDPSKTISLSNLNIAAKSVKLISDASNGYNVNSVTYTKQKKCTISPASLSFETYPNTVTLDKTFDVEYANYPVTVECSNDKFSFTPKDFGDCSEYGTQTISVHYAAGASAGEDVGYLYIKDNTGVTLRTCTLSVTINPKVDQSITPKNIGSSYKTTDKVTLTASTNSGLSNFTYSAAPAGVAVINGAEMTFTQSGTIAVTVSEPGSTIYNATSATVENIVVTKDVPNIPTVPAGTTVTYLQKLSSSTLSGGAADITLRGVAHTPVAGAFAWTDPEFVISENAGAHKYGVTFTPEDGGMYTNATCQVEIVVNRASQSLEMKNGAVLVAVGGIDAGKADSKLDLNSLIVSQTQDPVAANRAGAVTYEVISENKAKATISNVTTFSATEVGTYTIRATKAQTDYYNVATADFTVTVTRRPNTITTAGPYTKYVDEKVETVATVINSDGEIHTSSSDETVAYYDIENNRIVIPNSAAESFDTKKVTIKIWQDETERFEASDEKTIILTVKKYDNPFACSWGAWSYTANFEDVVPVEFTTANTDYANFPIVIAQTSGENVATLVNNDATNNTITASYVRENATWHLSQAESYKYKAGSQNVTMLVRTLPATCYIFESEQDKEYSFYNEANALSGHYDSPFEIHGPVKAITYEEKMEWSAINESFGNKYSVVQYSVDGGGTWRTLMRPDLTTDYKTYTREFSNADDPLGENEAVTHIRFGADRGGTMHKYYRNIKVTRATNIKPLDKENNLITSITMPQNTVGGSTTEKFYMKFSSCDEVVKLASNNPHFVLSNTEITVDPDDANNHAEITITYSSDEVGTHEGIITLYTKYQIRTFTVSGTTAQKVQTIDWKEGFTGDPLTLQKGLVVDNVNIAATASSERPVMYSTDNEEVIEIILNGLGFRIKSEGTANLTASEAGNAIWAPVSETKTIHATGKPVQTILWDQNLVNDLEPGQVIELDAKVYIRDAETGDLTYNAERTALINYSCSANSVISLDGKTITVTGYGQTTITATVAGDATYVEAQPVVVTVRVREPSAGCETPLVLDHPENVQLYSDDYSASGSLSEWTTPQIFSQIVLDRTKGKPDKLSYKHNGELASIPVFGAIKRCEGTVKVQERVNGNWTDVEGSSYNNGGQNGAYNWRDVIDIQLNEDADAIRFVREHHGSGAHNFKDIQITLLQYIRPVQAIMEAENVLDLGDIEIGEARSAVVPFDYSDVKGEILATKGNEEDNVLEINEKTVYLTCGSHGQYDLPITLKPTELGHWSNTVTLTDRLTNVFTTITIKANVVPGITYIFEGGEGEEGTQWSESGNWDESKKPGANDAVLINSDVEISGDVTVGSMTIAEGATVTVTVTGSLTLGDGSTKLRSEYGDLHVKEGGKVNVGNGTFIVRDFTLDASLGNASGEHATSGQFNDEDQKMYLTRDAYFQMSFDPSGAITYGWYDFTVPFEVDLMTGVFDENGNKLTYNVDYAVMEYSEAKRAAKAARPWTWFSGTMQPGKLYTITLDSEKTWNTFLFKKKANTAISINDSFNALCTETADTKDKGWNGLGNGMLQHCQLNNLPAQTKIQICDHENERYVERDAADYTYAVGTAFFIQVEEPKTIDLTAVIETRGFLAPMRENRVTDEFRLALVEDGQTAVADHLWVSANEEANGDYVIGRDLLKMGTPTNAKVAQMWAIRNDMILCDAEMPLIGNEANVNISLYAPKEAVYTIGVEKAPENAELYLTYNGQVIWNLTTGAYTVELAKGTTTGYGLQIEASQAPQIATGVENTATDTQSARKVLINNTLYIVTPDGKMYNAAGKNVQ